MREEYLMTLQEPGTRRVDPPESNLTPSEMIARATALRGKLRERQEECEALGRLPDATLQDYLGAGFYRVMQPRRFGGYEFDLDTFLRVTVELSRGCPSSGWVFGLMATHNLIAGLFEEQGQVELFGDGDFRCPLSALPASALKVDGGYRITGWWDYASGCDVATHFLGDVAVVDEPGGELIDTRLVAMRRDQFQIVDNWDTLGMRGTGSRRVVVEDLFIPEHHTVPSPNPVRPVVEFPGRGLHPNPMFYGSLWPLLISEPAAVCVGIAHAAIDDYIENLTTKHQWGPMSPKRSELPLFQRLLGEATAYVDTAEATLHQVAQIWTERARRSMETGEPPSDEDDRRLILVEQQIVELASNAVETIFRTSGSSAAKRGQRIERYFRDLNMVRTHIMFQFERTRENVGHLRLGLQPEMPF
jgi:3-hydroxy-9,10-secoandrosta-1,3,5(10)-triene-9,17-dione monooxygenase